MGQQKFVNRTLELEIFNKMVSGNLEDRILLIRAESGMGKSSLLSHFEKNCPPNVKFVPVDFKGGAVNLAEVFSRMRDWLGKDKFQKFNQTVETYVVKAAINISNNNLIGTNKIDVALTGGENSSRDERQVDLTDAFFTDLKDAGKVVFAFDTFNACQLPVTTWLTSAFLPRFRLNTNLSAIIAGQSTPEPALEWASIQREIVLTGMNESHWIEFARSSGIHAHEEFIKGICVINHGQPLLMVSMIQAFASLSVQQ